MAALQNVARPIQALRDNVTALEGAITLTVADPKPRPVHRLRTSTRRIEALLLLLELLPELPDYTKPARKSRKLLKKLRRAAGAVRDLDVQGDLVRSLAEGNDPHPATSLPDSHLPASSNSHQQAPPRNPDGTDSKSLAKRRHKLNKDADHLGKTIQHHRDREAESLIATIQKLQPLLSPTLERLLDVLAPATFLAISNAQLTALTLQWYGHHIPDPAQTTRSDDADLLHTVRKSAKLARYMAEVAGSEQIAIAPLQTKPHASPTTSSDTPATIQRIPGESASEVAASFESLQQAGGTWHDLLTLADTARHHLGKRSPLTRHLETACEEALRNYQRCLQTGAGGA